MSTQWHRFVASSDDDSECANPECGLIVCDSALRQIAIDCPAPTCDDDSNADGRCVMAPAAQGPGCVYCGRAGCYVEEVDDDDLDDDDLDVFGSAP